MHVTRAANGSASVPGTEGTMGPAAAQDEEGEEEHDLFEVLAAAAVHVSPEKRPLSPRWARALMRIKKSSTKKTAMEAAAAVVSTALTAAADKLTEDPKQPSPPPSPPQR